MAYSELNQLNVSTMCKTEITFNDLPMVISRLVDKVESLEEVLRQKLATTPSAEKENRHVPLTVKEACKYLKMPAATFYYKMERSEIAAVKQVKRYYIYQDELDSWLECGRKNPVPLTPEEQNDVLLASHRRKPNPPNLILSNREM